MWGYIRLRPNVVMFPDTDVLTVDWENFRLIFLNLTEDDRGFKNESKGDINLGKWLMVKSHKTTFAGGRKLLQDNKHCPLYGFF